MHRFSEYFVSVTDAEIIKHTFLTSTLALTTLRSLHLVQLLWLPSQTRPDIKILRLINMLPALPLFVELYTVMSSMLPPRCVFVFF